MRAIASLRAGFLRNGLLGVALVLAAALVLGSARSFAVARSLAQGLTRAQIDTYFHDLRAYAMSRGRPSPEDLADLYNQHKAEGLAFAAIVSRDGTILSAAGAGRANGPPPSNLPLPEIGEIQPVGERVRMLVPAPPPGPDGPGPEAGGLLLFEFEPHLARQLVADAARGLVVSTAAALLLATAAIVLWRLSAKVARTEEALAEQRHLAALGEMAAVLAHEIRNPLAIAKGHAQLLAEQPSGGDQTRAWADLIVENATRLENLTSQLLDFAKSGALQREPVAPSTLLEEAARAVAPDRITIDAAGAPEEWSIDPERMRQVLINLLDNAIQASPAAARVEAAVFESGGRLVFEVRDRGSGVPPEERKRIFAPFYTTRIRGTGLGLAVASRIVALHGGLLSVFDHPDGGAIFHAEIPKTVKGDA